MSGIATAMVGSAVVGGVIQAEGQKSAARSAATAAKDAAAVETQGYMEAMGIQEDALDVIKKRVGKRESAFNRILKGATSPAAFRQLDKFLQQGQQNVDRQLALYNSLDPAVMEASKQALAIMQGGSAAQSTGLAKRRQSERQKLISRLREQLGPGAETSTAGMQALNQFDSQTEELQQQTMTQLFNMGQAGAAARGNFGNTLSQFATTGQNLRSARAEIGLNALAGMSAGDSMIQQGYSNIANARIGQGSAAAGQYAAGALNAIGQSQAAQTYGGAVSNLGGQLTGYLQNRQKNNNYSGVSYTNEAGDQVDDYFGAGVD